MPGLLPLRLTRMPPPAQLPGPPPSSASGACAPPPAVVASLSPLPPRSAAPAWLCPRADQTMPQLPPTNPSPSTGAMPHASRRCMSDASRASARGTSPIARWPTRLAANFMRTLSGPSASAMCPQRYANCASRAVEGTQPGDPPQHMRRRRRASGVDTSPPPGRMSTCSPTLPGTVHGVELPTPDKQARNTPEVATKRARPLEAAATSLPPAKLRINGAGMPPVQKCKTEVYLSVQVRFFRVSPETQGMPACLLTNQAPTLAGACEDRLEVQESAEPAVPEQCSQHERHAREGLGQCY